MGEPPRPIKIVSFVGTLVTAVWAITGGPLLRAAGLIGDASAVHEFWAKFRNAGGPGVWVAILCVASLGVGWLHFSNRPSDTSDESNGDGLVDHRGNRLSARSRTERRRLIAWAVVLVPPIAVFVMLGESALAHHSPKPPDISRAIGGPGGASEGGGPGGTGHGGGVGFGGRSGGLATPETKRRPRSGGHTKPDHERDGEARTITVNAPGGVAIGRDNYGNPTVNYYAPPQRKLSGDQREKFVAFLRDFCPFDVSVRAVPGNLESQRYGQQIAEALTAAGCKPKPPIFLIENGQTVGMFLGLRDESAGLPALKAMLAAFKDAGIPLSDPVGHAIPGLEAGEVYVFVEVNDVGQPP